MSRERRGGAGRIVLVKPPERSAFDFGTFSLGVLAAAVRDLAPVEIVDATDATVEEAAAAVAARPAGLVGVTAMGFTSVRPVGALLRSLRRRYAGERPALVAGGHGASSLPAEVLAAGADAVVVGEGERTFRRIVERGLQRLPPEEPGLVRLVGGRVRTGPPRRLIFPLDALEPPARDLMPPPVDGVHLLETSRGCPHACAFCEATRFYGRRWRALSQERVVAEVRRLVEDHDAYVVQLADDNFTANPVRAAKICEALVGERLPAFFMASGRADDLLRRSDLLPAMARARVLRVAVGVETLEPGIAAGVGKPIPLDTYRRAFSVMRGLGIFSVASLIVGLPGETSESRKRAVELAVAAGPDAARFVPFLPVPGTPLGDGAARRDGYRAAEDDRRAAARFTRAFYAHPRVRGRLEGAVRSGGVRGLLAAGTLERYPRLGA